MHGDSVLIDHSAPEVLTDHEVRAWARDQRVFISSVMQGMQRERAAVANAVEGLGAVPVWFEKFGGRDDDPETAYLTEVASSDIYVGVLGERYGTPMPNGYSATHAEYREAVRGGLRVTVWANTGTLSGPQTDFLQEVRVFRTTGSYSDANDLAAGVVARLRSLAADSLSPWVKIGRVVLRARRVNHDGTRIEVEARVRDDAVMAVLEGMRPDGTWRTSQDVTVTWGGRTETVRGISVRSETTAGRGGLITFSGERVDRSRPPFADVGFEGRTPDELTELAVRVALFGEENPLGTMSFLAEFENPFDQIDRLGLPEDAVEPVSHLLLTESLVGGSRADRITHLEVGPPNRGARRVVLEWTPRRRYSNVLPTVRRVEGKVSVQR